MKSIDLLTDSRHHSRLRTFYRRLTFDQQQEVEAGFRRHRAACAKLQIRPDPQWVIEMIEEAKSGRGTELF